MRTTFRSLLESGKKFKGCYITIPSPQIIEVMRCAGLDFVMLDLLHDGLTIADLRPMIMAADACGMAVMARVEADDAEKICKVLDLGVSALRIPNVHNADIAALAVKNALYAPTGTRSVCPNVRANHYACFGPVDIEKANSELVISAIIESQEGIENLEEIIKVPGIDAISIGRSDFANVKGVPGQQEHPLVEEAVRQTAAACHRLGKSCSVTVSKPDQAGKYRDMPGISFFTVRQPVNILYDGYKAVCDRIDKAME